MSNRIDTAWSQLEELTDSWVNKVSNPIDGFTFAFIFSAIIAPGFFICIAIMFILTKLRVLK